MSGLLGVVESGIKLEIGDRKVRGGGRGGGGSARPMAAGNAGVNAALAHPGSCLAGENLGTFEPSTRDSRIARFGHERQLYAQHCSCSCSVQNMRT